MRMLRLRNDESYHYNQESAIELCQMIPELLPYFDNLKEKIITFGYASIDLYGASVRGKEESDDIRRSSLQKSLGFLPDFLNSLYLSSAKISR